jgi:hypothetical protein
VPFEGEVGMRKRKKEDCGAAAMGELEEVYKQ